MPRFDCVIFNEDSYRPSVGLEISDARDIDDSLDTDFRNRLWNAHIFTGLLISRGTMRVYEDLLSGDSPQTYKTRSADTRSVLKVVARDEEELDRPDMYHILVEDWLRRIRLDWSLAIPSDLIEVFGGLIPIVSDGRYVYGYAAEEVAK